MVIGIRIPPPSLLFSQLESRSLMLKESFFFSGSDPFARGDIEFLSPLKEALIALADEDD